MSIIRIINEGSFKNVERFFSFAKSADFDYKLKRCGEMGVEALKANTPKDTGYTAEQWQYVINKSKDGIQINWFNNNINDGFNVAVGIQYGHGTRNGSYIQGIDYINPSLKPVFDSIVNDIWNEIQRW